MELNSSDLGAVVENRGRVIDHKDLGNDRKSLEEFERGKNMIWCTLSSFYFQIFQSFKNSTKKYPSPLFRFTNFLPFATFAVYLEEYIMICWK